MSPFSQLLSPQAVLCDLEVTSKKRVFEQVGIQFENTLGIARSVVFDSLFARERLGSTGLGQGIAIPHGRVKGLKQAAAAFVRLKSPLPFDALDGQPVKLLFFLLVPQQATEEHLQILSEIAQMFSDRPFRDKLIAASSAEELFQLLATWSSHAAS